MMKGHRLTKDAWFDLKESTPQAKKQNGRFSNFSVVSPHEFLYTNDTVDFLGDHSVVAKSLKLSTSMR